jgi:N-acyl-D-aspartate/D-glutamate deacylase
MADRRWDVVIRSATIFDGTGGKPFVADLAITDDRIAELGQVGDVGGVEINGEGLALAPGFIDVHSHDDFAVLLTPEMDFKVMQGVTTDVVGNCGMGAAPYVAAGAFFHAIHGDVRVPEWEDYRGYFEVLDRNPSSCNVGVLVGHGTLRAAAMGNAPRAPDAGEMAAMRRWLREALDAGALGLSTGLIYEPGRYATTEEIIQLAREMRGSGALYTSHMRNEAGGLLDSIRETIRIGEVAGVPVEVSHHKASGRENWGRVRDSLRLIEEARARGVDVNADQYPYTSGSTVLSAVLQNNALNERGREGGIGIVAPENVLVASAPRHPDYEGKTIRQLADTFGMEPEKAAQRVVAEEGHSAVVVIEIIDETDVRTVLRHPTTVIGSDGIPAGSRPHPRLYGTFPRVLGRYARDLGLLTMEEAIHRMTGMAAEKFGLYDRGVIRAGAYADLVLFDPTAIIDMGTYSDPRRYPEGIKYVFVNGTAVVSNGHHSGARPGRALRRD